MTAFWSLPQAVSAAPQVTLAARGGGTHEPAGMLPVGPGVNSTPVLPPLFPAEDAWGQACFAGQAQWPEFRGRQNLTLVRDPTYGGPVVAHE